MSYFSNLGRRFPEDGMRVFNKIPSEYYKLVQPKLDYGKILGRLKLQGLSPLAFSESDFERNTHSLLNLIEGNDNYKNLLNGVHIPFVFSSINKIPDLGSHIEDCLLPSVQKSFNNAYPQSHFKAVLQSNSELQGNINIAHNSGYKSFIESTLRGTVVGWYFPQALQEFDIASQRRQMCTLSQIKGAQICLSGAIDICAAVVGSPGLLINEEFYAPILCMSAYVHDDPRMVLVLKAYGPHLEFWCMTQMLSSNTTQVSEQWSGGICIYVSLD